MKSTKALIANLVLATLTTTGVLAQDKLPTSQNAALRYWMAFALLQNPPADPGIQAQLLEVASSNAPWDEQKLGALVESNRDAILTMQRAVILPECNWGLDYELGPDTPVAHIPKARVLARLNVLYGIRQMAQRDSGGAVDTWLAGLRFSKHLTEGASLFGALTANSSLTEHLRAMRAAVENKSINNADVQRIELVAKDLPPFGINWGDAIRFESAATSLGFQKFAESPNPKNLYFTWFGENAPDTFRAPTREQIREYQVLMERVALAFQRPYADLTEVASLQSQISRIHPLIARSLPNLTRVAGVRRDAGLLRQSLLDAITARRK